MAKDLNSILDSAKFLMSEEGQRQINFAAKNNNFDGNEDGFSVNTHVPDKYKGTSNSIKEQKMNFSEDMAAKMNLPKSILEAMEEDYGEGGMLSSKNTNAVLTETVIHETTSAPRYNPQPQSQQYIPSNNGIDYTIIKAIVEECVKRNLEGIKESILSESALKTVRLGGNNKIQLVDSKGNLYESTLTFKKNISKK
jgi:hypothetical protein